MTPSNRSSWKNRALFWGFQHTSYGVFSGDRWENVHFEIKPRHVTPQINCLRITSTVLSVSTHIYGVFHEIDGKMCIFRVNLDMWPLKSIVSEKRSHVLRVSSHIYGVSHETDRKTFILRVNLGMWPLKLICLGKTSTLLRVSTQLLWGFPRR